MSQRNQAPPQRYARYAVYAALTLVLLVTLPKLFSASTDNDFDLSDTLMPRAQIHHGGPPRDGIPAIDEPEFLEPAAAGFLNDQDRVLGMVRNGISKAYPVRILNYHEIVNDRFGDEAVVVSFCPLCGTGMAFAARVAGETHSFGVSGLLYNSDVLLYDRETESLWSQIMRKAISGPRKGTELEQLPLAHTTWRDWRQRHPQTLVLSTDTGYRRDYSRTPYQGYGTSDAIYFPVSNINRKYHPKEMVLGLTVNGSAKVYPFAELAKGPATFTDQVGGQSVVLEFDARNRTGRALDRHGEGIPSVLAFWFAWIAFHPDTAIYEPD